MSVWNTEVWAAWAACPDDKFFPLYLIFPPHVGRSFTFTLFHKVTLSHLMFMHKISNRMSSCLIKDERFNSFFSAWVTYSTDLQLLKKKEPKVILPRSLFGKLDSLWFGLKTNLNALARKKQKIEDGKQCILHIIQNLMLNLRLSGRAQVWYKEEKKMKESNFTNYSSAKLRYNN